MPVKVGLKHIEIWNDSMEKTVLRYEAEEQPQDQIVFYGPSNFTRWSQKYGMIPLREAVVGKSGAPCTVNRGFGSSCAEHQLYYYPRLVRPLNPRVLVYSPGFGNGLAFGYTLEELWELAQRVLCYAKTDFPDLRIYLCGAQHNLKNTSPERKALQAEWNALLKEYADTHPDCAFVTPLDYAPLLRDDIFISDNTHYNQEGYNLYADYFREVLKDELAQY